jgi:RNA polymerase sigma factor (sigma-70 family)
MNSTHSLDIYLASLHKYKLFTKEEEILLLMELKDLRPLPKKGTPPRVLTLEENKRANKIIDMLVKANIRYVVSYSRDFVSEVDLYEDLIAEGNMALLKAIEKYDPSKLNAQGDPHKLITYAKWWLFQAILLYKSTHSYTVKLPVNIVHEGLRLSKEIKKELDNSEGDYVDEHIIAKNANVSVDKVEKILNHMNAHMSNQCQNELKYIPDDRPDKVIENHQDHIDQALSVLSPTQIDIIKRLNALSPYEREYNLIEISMLYGKTAERIRQIKEEALNKLKLIYTAEELHKILF